MLELTRMRIQADIGSTIQILHLSDLHGTWFGANQEKLIGLAQREIPDRIVVTGDFIDNTCDEKPSAVLIKGMAKIAPVYCVTGNHEERERAAGAASYEHLIAAIEHTENACLLRGETVRLTEKITLTGADDYDFIGGRDAYPEYLKRLYTGAAGGFRILLAHRPEMFAAYAEAGFDLTLSGHAHGGQIRLPGIGGLFAPGQGIFPKLTEGVHVHANGNRMYISRGLGNSVPVPRINNRPEITMIEIG